MDALGVNANAAGYCLPTHIEQGKGAVQEVGRLVARYGGTKALVLFGDSSVLLSGLVKRVINSLDRSLLDHVVLGGFRPGEQMAMVSEGIPFVRDEHVNFVLAVGASHVIDAAKLIAAGAAYDGDWRDFAEGYEPKEALPVGCLLTKPGTGAEASPDAFLLDVQADAVRHVRGAAMTPAFTVLDSQVIASQEKFPIKDADGVPIVKPKATWAELAYTTV